MKQKYSFKCKNRTSSSQQQAKLKKVKKEKNQTADEQEQIMKNRAHKVDKLNPWKEENMEAAVKEWVQFNFWLIRFKLQQNTQLDTGFRM